MADESIQRAAAPQAVADDPSTHGQATAVPPEPRPVSPTRNPAGPLPASNRKPDGGLFHKRDDAIGQAPVFFSIALGIAFGSSVGLLVGQPIIGIIFGGLLGALYGVIRHSGGPHR